MSDEQRVVRARCQTKGCGWFVDGTPADVDDATDLHMAIWIDDETGVTNHHSFVIEPVSQADNEGKPR